MVRAQLPVSTWVIFFLQTENKTAQFVLSSSCKTKLSIYSLSPFKVTQKSLQDTKPTAKPVSPRPPLFVPLYSATGRGPNLQRCVETLVVYRCGHINDKFAELCGSSGRPVCSRSLQKEGGWQSFFLVYDSPTERSRSCKHLPPLAVKSVERDWEGRGKEDKNLFPPRNLPTLLGQEGDLGFQTPKHTKAGQGRRCLVERMVHHLPHGRLIRFASYAGRVTRQLIK